MPRVTSDTSWHWLRSVQASLVAAAPLTPVMAALFTVAAFLAPADSLAHWIPGDHVLIAFALNLLFAWVVLAVLWGALGYTGCSRVNMSSFNGLCAHLADLEARHTHLCGAAADPVSRLACEVANTHRSTVLRELQIPGVSWVLGGGYVAGWERVSRAEEALIRVATPSELISHGLSDLARCTGSSIENRAELAERIRATIAFLRSADDGARPQETRPTDGGAPTAPDHPALYPVSLDEVRETLVMVRRTVNDYRGERWSGLIRARNHLAAAAAVTGLTVYSLLWLAILMGSAADTIGLATAYYLIGATVGLLNRFYSEAGQTDSVAVDDYGLSLSRLIVTPLLSGVAAIGGVLVIAMLALTQTGSIGASGVQPPISLVSFLDLSAHPFNIVIAATFGLTPGLLVDRLRSQADSYRNEIEKTNRSSNLPATLAAARR
jgi:hypothetical protein